MFFINGVGHGTIQFNDMELKESSFIELQYTGQPKIVLKELELLFHRAMKKNKLSESSWATAEYISLFRKEDDSIEIASDYRRGDIDFEYKVIMDFNEWKIEYEHIDQRGGLDSVVGKKNHIDVDFLNGFIMKEDDYFWDNCGEKKTFIIQKGSLRDINKLESEISDYKQIITHNKTLATVLISGHIDEVLKYIELFGQHNPQFKQTAKKLMMEFYVYIKGDSTKTADIMARAYSLARKGNNYIQKADYGKALDCFEKALDLCPNDIILLNNIAYTYEKLEKCNKAIETYEKSLKINPSHANAWNGLALSYKKLGKYEEAIRACKKAIELDPNDKDFQNNFVIIMTEYHLKDPSKRKDNKIKMHEYWAFSFLCSNIEEKQDYRIDWLKKNVKEIVIDTGEEKSNDEISVETVIDPIINVFSSYGKTPVKCLAINYGYRCWTSEKLSNSRNRILLDYIGNIQSRINLEIFKCILEIINLKESEPINIFYGMCNDHSYVQEYESENIIKLGVKPHDKYIWFDSNGKKEDSEGVSYSEVIYRLFPKKYITLPSKESSINTEVKRNNKIYKGKPNPDLIKLERIDYTDQVLDAIKNWKTDPQLIDLEEYNKYKEIILLKIKDKKIPYTIQIDRITIDTNSQGEKEEEFILSLEFDDMYLNFIEDVYFSTECSSLHYDYKSEIKELCEIWGERPLKLKEQFYGKDNEYEKRFLYIERNLFRGNKFSIAKSELGNIIHEAKIKNLSKVLDRARELLRLCNSKEREFSKKIDENNHLSDDEVSALLNLSRKDIDEKEKLIKQQLSKAKNLFYQKKALEAKEILEKVISEGKKIKEIVNSYKKKHLFSIIINQAEDLLDYCENFLQNKENLTKIEELIEDKKFLKANVNLKDLIDEIKTYIGDREILHEEILNKALNLFKENRLQDIERDIILKKKLIQEDISKAKNLIYQKKISEGIKLLENVIQESKFFSGSFSSIIFSQASEVLDLGQDFKNNKNKLMKIENLIEEKKYSIAVTRLKDLIDEIESYIGDKKILNNEILNEALILFKKNRKYMSEDYIPEDYMPEDSISEEEMDEINEIEKEIKKYNIKSLTQNVNSITELHYTLPKRSEFLNRLYNIYVNSNSKYLILFKTELTALINQFYIPYLEFNPFDVNIQYFPQTFFNIKSSDLIYFNNFLNIDTSNKEFERLLKQIEMIDYGIMFDKKLEKIGKQTQKFSYDIPVENLFNLLLDFMKILPDPTTVKIEDSNDEYILQTTWGILHFRIIEILPFEKLIYEYDFLKSNWGEKGKLLIDFLEPNLGKAIIHIRNEIIEVAKHHKEKLIIHNFIGNNLKSFIDMNIGKIVAKQIHAIIYEKSFDDLTRGNYRILQAKINSIGKNIENLKNKFFEVKAPLTLNSFNCSECGATLNITSKEEKFIICEHCDTPFLMKWLKD